jgi:tetratricopeptide (TPR) repeat protein
VIRSPTFFWSWAVPLVLFVVLIMNRKRMPAVLAGFGIFVIGLLPVLGLTPFMYQLHSTVADHYMYLPMFGIALAVASVVSLRPSSAVISAYAIGLVVLGALSMLQTRWWREDIAFSQRGVDLYPESVDAHASMGRALASAGRVEEAVPHFRFVAAARPASVIAHTLLGRALAVTGHLEEADREFSVAVQLNPNDGALSAERDALRARLKAPATSP